MGVSHPFLPKGNQGQKILEDELVARLDLSAGTWRLTITSFHLGIDLGKVKGRQDMSLLGSSST